jgi:transposase InsO family protein
VVPIQTTAPNGLWTADFKGQFRTCDGIYCFPLTIVDQHTRYLLGVQGLLTTKGDGVRRSFERTFREYGLPDAIRTDNGVPFANTGRHGLTQLNVWWLRLEIQHQRIRPASAQENGAHERMHRTLTAATTHPPATDLSAQQRVVRRFQHEYDLCTTKNDRTLHSMATRPPHATRARSGTTQPRSRLSNIPATSR